MPERRRSPRYPFQTDVEVQWGFETLSALMTDVALSGMFIATSNPLWVGAAFTVRILLAEPITVDCTVRRVLPGKGMGVSFEKIADEDRGRLAKLIETLAAS